MPDFKKIYVCYQISKVGNILEFWSINKRLYDTFVDIYKDALLDRNRYLHVIAPMRKLDYFEKFQQDSKLIYYKPDKYFRYPLISTTSHMEILDPNQVLPEYLMMPNLDIDQISRLPDRILRVIQKTNYYKLLDSWNCDRATDPVDVDEDIMFYVAHCVYFGIWNFDQKPVDRSTDG